MKLKFRSVRWLALLLAAVMLIPAVPASAARSGKPETLPWRFSAVPEKADYAAGEEIIIRSKLENVSFSDMLDVELSMQFTQTDTYLVSGDIYYDIGTLGVGHTLEKRFNLFENTGNQALGEKWGALLARLVKFLGWLFSSLSPLLRHTESAASNAFRGFPEGLSGRLLPKIRQQAGACYVTYDGQVIGCTFYISYRKTANTAPAAARKTGESDAPFTLRASLTPSADDVSGLFFGAQMTGTGFDGGFFFLSAARNWAGVARMEYGKPKFLSVKYAAMEPGRAYDVKIQYGDGRLIAWLYNNPLDEDPWPLFDIPVAFDGTAYGVCGAAENVTVTDAPPAYEGETYTNPLYPNSADPFVLYEDGVYYLYATNNGEGFNAATSTDLVHWTDIGQVAFKDDIVGEYYFWAPEVYKYNGRYYLFYSAEGHLGVAAADSPAGPFVKTSDDFLMEREAIDGHVFFDDDGKIWLYLVHFGEGNHIWVYELNDDLISVKEGSGVKLTVPEGWEGTINEGPAVLKHNGTYYLTYSGDDYLKMNYDVGVMTSDSPTGPFTRYEGNPILRADSFIHGTGHHCFAYSPDGTEMFIVYHSHNTLTQVHPRALNIDRVKFVPQENGPDLLVVYGPTVTPQPMPSGAE
ncbi:MAG: glycoside hydrolase family 43 protein [Clostridia bacterium]|nr:glycoside hydrolase family 43 protein [Clostridia bacterium]